MAKYIGKRIVPKHCGVWDQSRIYEMLSIVMEPISGDSYISRRAVPSGTAITDETFWALHSKYSQQIKDMSDQLAATEARIKADNDITVAEIAAANAATEEAVNETVAELRRVVDTSNANHVQAEETLGSRINSIINSGADIPDAEVADARVDHSGITHESLGDAIRESDVDIRACLDLYSQGVEYLADPFRLGTYDGDGVYYGTGYKHRICTTGRLAYNRDIIIHCAEGFTYAYEVFDDEGNVQYYDRWINTDKPIPANTVFEISIQPDPVDTTVEADIAVYRKAVNITTIPDILSDRIRYLDEELNAKEATYTIIPELIVNEAVQRADGEFISYSGYCRTEFIDVSLAKCITIPETMTNCGFYDAEYGFLRFFRGGEDVAIPETASYAALSGPTSKNKDLRIVLKKTGAVHALVEKIEYNHIADELYGKKVLNKAGVPLCMVEGVELFPGNLIVPSECESGFIVYSSGDVASSDKYFSTGYIPVTPGESYRGNKIRNGAWYDEDKQYISGFQGVRYTLAAPEDAAYVRYCFNISEDTDLHPYNVYFTREEEYSEEVRIQGVLLREPIEVHPWCYGMKINWLGDSIVADYDFDEVVCEALGLVETDYGIGGSTIALKSDGSDGRHALCARFDQMSDDADIIAVSAGTNDYQYSWSDIGTIDSTENTTFYGALKNLCEGLINKYPRKVIFFTTPIKRAQKFDSSGDFTTPFSKNEKGMTLKQYCDIIKEVCSYYSIPVLDMWSESLLNPHMESQADMFDSVRTHPNQAGRNIMARRICGWLNQLGYTIG